MSSGQFVYSYFSYSTTRFSYSLHRFVLFSIFSILLPFLGLWGVSFGPVDMTSSTTLLFLVSFGDSWGVSYLSRVIINNGTTCISSGNNNRTQTIIALISKTKIIYWDFLLRQLIGIVLFLLVSANSYLILV